MPMDDYGLEQRWTRARARARQGKLSSGTDAGGAAVQMQGANRERHCWGSRLARARLWRLRELGLTAAVAQAGRGKKG